MRDVPVEGQQHSDGPTGLESLGDIAVENDGFGFPAPISPSTSPPPSAPTSTPRPLAPSALALVPPTTSASAGLDDVQLLILESPPLAAPPTTRPSTSRVSGSETRLLALDKMPAKKMAARGAQH